MGVRGKMRHCMLLIRQKGGRAMNNNADCGMMSLSRMPPKRYTFTFYDNVNYN